MKLPLLTAALAGLCLSTYAQAPNIIWQNSYGGTGFETANDIKQTTDGGYVVAGTSMTDNGDVTGTHGQSDFWIVKLSQTGALQWQKSLGGTLDDEAFSIAQTTDQGYIVTGWEESKDYDPGGTNRGGRDAWLVKLNSSGVIQWHKVIGGTQMDYLTYVVQTADGGFITTGFTQSADSDVSPLNHGSDMWVVKFNSTGDIQWQKTLGGMGTEYGFSIQPVSAGGYIVTGQTDFSDGQVTGVHGAIDAWVVKLDDTGGITWQKALGGTSLDLLRDIKPTPDGGYIAAGWTSSNDGDVTGNTHNTQNVWIVKLSSSGTIQWQKVLGGSIGDLANSVQLTTDGNYLVSGNAGSSDGDVTNNKGKSDVWVLKVSSTGALLWQKTLGTTESDLSFSCLQADDGNYVVAGTNNANNGDVTTNHGNSDMWVMKLQGPLSIKKVSKEAAFSISPNPAYNIVNIRVEGNASAMLLSITDMYGRMISNTIMNGDHTELDVQSLPVGCYTINLTGDAVNASKLFIKQ